MMITAIQSFTVTNIIEILKNVVYSSSVNILFPSTIFALFCTKHKHQNEGFCMNTYFKKHLYFVSFWKCLRNTYTVTMHKTKIPCIHASFCLPKKWTVSQKISIYKSRCQYFKNTAIGKHILKVCSSCVNKMMFNTGHRLH